MNDFDLRQVRGERDAYLRYLSGMDASMRQKVALTAAHLLCVGKVADMGMGSGAGSDALAALYPSLDVVGVDLDPNMVDLAAAKYQRKNLTFVRGDIAGEVFPPDSLDGIFDSSVLHHVTSFGGYRHENAEAALRAQARSLREGGTLVVRDFLAPPLDEFVLLDVPTDDGDDSEDPASCCSAHLLERFARDFRVLHGEPGFDMAIIAVDPRPGWRRYCLKYRHAVEFVLRKDYRSDYAGEVKEEYTYFTQLEFERTFAALGLRLLASTPIRNPWVVHQRFEGKFVLQTMVQTPLPHPATNYVIAGEKIAPGTGVAFLPHEPRAPLGFLQMTHYRHKQSGEERDLVRRPHVTVDVIPYFESSETNHELMVLARMSYPRPVLSTRADVPSLDEGRAPHYVTEPLNVLLTDKSLGQTVEEMLYAHARIAPRDLRRFRLGPTYYPSAGGSQEEVRSVFVEVEPLLVQNDLPNLSGLSTSGRVRAIEAQQVLRAAQVGGLPDARLELNVYDLLLHHGRRPTPWLGDEIALRPAVGITPTPWPTVAERRPRRAFERVAERLGEAFLEIRCKSFRELGKGEVVLHEEPYEYVVPRTLSPNSMACAVLARHGDTVLLGVDDDDLPAAQCFAGNSDILVAPAYRLPFAAQTSAAAWAFVEERLQREYRLTIGKAWDLGGPYFPSAGMSPELVYPLAVEVLGPSEAPGAQRNLLWIPLRDVALNRHELHDGHLRIVALRAAHALGLLGSGDA